MDFTECVAMPVPLYLRFSLSASVSAALRQYSAWSMHCCYIRFPSAIRDGWYGFPMRKTIAPKPNMMNVDNPPITGPSILPGDSFRLEIEPPITGLRGRYIPARILDVMTAGRTLRFAVLLTVWIVAASVACAATSPPPSHCVFHRVDNHFGGSCGALFDQTPAMMLSPVPRITTGIWRDDVHPASVW